MGRALSPPTACFHPNVQISLRREYQVPSSGTRFTGSCLTGQTCAQPAAPAHTYHLSKPSPFSWKQEPLCAGAPVFERGSHFLAYGSTWPYAPCTVDGGTEMCSPLVSFPPPPLGQRHRSNARPALSLVCYKCILRGSWERNPTTNVPQQKWVLLATHSWVPCGSWGWQSSVDETPLPCPAEPV